MSAHLQFQNKTLYPVLFVRRANPLWPREKRDRPTRAQRISATRAAHRVLKRIRNEHTRALRLFAIASRESRVAGSFNQQADLLATGIAPLLSGSKPFG